MTQVVFPTVTDDSGTGQDGTTLNSALFTSIKTGIDNVGHSTTNPTVATKDVIDEVVTARGSKTTLTGRLDVALNSDGTLKPVAGQASLSDIPLWKDRNLVTNDDFQIWPAGDTSAPASWTLTGSTIARSGTGLGDTTRKIGDFCVALTNTGTLKQALLSAGAFTRTNFAADARKFGFGCWVKTTIASHARIYLDDGVATTVSAYHTGSGNWEWLYLQADTTECVRTINGAGSKLDLALQVSANGTAYFSGPTVVQGGRAPSEHIPCEVIYGFVQFASPGNLAVGTEKDFTSFSRPTIVRDAYARVRTAPTTQAITMQLNHWDGAAFTNMFSGAAILQIAASAKVGSAQPDGTYRYRCFTGVFGTTITDGLLGFDINQVGSGTVGADLRVMVRCMQYLTPLEKYRAYNEQG